MALLILNPIDGWVDLGAVGALIVCQVDPRVTSVRTPAIEVRRGDESPAHDQAGVVQMGGWTISQANIDTLGVGSRVYARALVPSARIVVDASA